MIKRIALNFFLGYGSAAAVLNMVPVQKETVPVAVFDVQSDQVVSYHTTRVKKTAPKLFDFDDQD